MRISALVTAGASAMLLSCSSTPVAEAPSPRAQKDLAEALAGHAVMIRNGQVDGGYDPRREGIVLLLGR